MGVLIFKSVRRLDSLEILAVRIDEDNAEMVCDYVERELGGYATVRKRDGRVTFEIKYGLSCTPFTEFGSWLVCDSMLLRDWGIFTDKEFRKHYRINRWRPGIRKGGEE